MDFIGESDLAKQDELSSTEKLLELIRDEGPASPHTGPYDAPQAAGQRFKNLLSNSLSFGKSAWSAGVDLGHEDVKLVKVKRVSDRKIEITDFTRVALDPEIPRDHPNFHQFLRATLIKFCGSANAVELWGTIPSVVEMQSEGGAVSDKIALVLTDLEMPEMDGFTLTRNIKQDPRFSSIPVVIHSSLTGSANEAHVKKVGADAYVAKFVAEDLANALRQALRTVH